MLQNTKTVFLTGIVAISVVISPLSINYAFARAISDQDINSQELEVRTAYREAIEEYTRLVLYLIVFKLETRLENQST